jgi:hypothetical protein
MAQALVHGALHNARTILRREFRQRRGLRDSQKSES